MSEPTHISLTIHYRACVDLTPPTFRGIDQHVWTLRLRVLFLLFVSIFGCFLSDQMPPNAYSHSTYIYLSILPKRPFMLRADGN